ncbi:hypothetical protein B0O99DRAFT_589086 [Bisporella sp. PMI_857]|nr:hypothetical protein B0O99DRAFT_589086 [Bisporella sp. PMI_857]
MNLGDLDLQRVQHNRPQIQRVVTDELPVTPVHVRLDNDFPASVTSTISDPTTVVRWQTPPRLPTPPYNEHLYESQSDHEPRNDYALRNNLTPRSEHTIRNELMNIERTKTSIGVNEAAYASNTPLVVRFDEKNIRTDAEVASKRERMDIANMESSPPTPVDDTPYIRFAIDQLTRDQEIGASHPPSITDSSDSYPVERLIPDLGLGYVPRPLHTREELALARKHRSSPDSGRLFKYNATRPLSLHLEPETNLPQHPQQHVLPSSSEVFLPIDVPAAARYPDLTFVPTILRPLSIMTLSLLCSLMIAALIFCAVYSTSHNGLTEWRGAMYSGRYFVFGYLPQILAACILIYVQCVMSAMTRIMPFAMMAMKDAERRINALYLDIYPKTMLLPQREGSLATTLYWLTIFTIPLQSCLFSAILVDGKWRWATVQGVAWTLVAIYILLLIATLMTGWFFFYNDSGLIWDPRSLADLITLLPRSNALRDYSGTDIMATKHEIRDKLMDRSDRLGYWTTKAGTGPIFYCLGEQGATTRRYTLQQGRIQEKATSVQFDDVEKAADLHSRGTRFRHIPWYLRDTFVILWAVATFVLLIALIILSFLPSTAIRKGFLPLVEVQTNAQGFSPSNFLYSFVPSLIGMILYLLFQPLDMAVRILQPWSELWHRDGQTASKSLLLDYSASLPIACTINALSHKHLRVALLSLLSFIFIILPVLAGGLFFPLTTPSMEVRMIPSMPAFYVLLVLLILYLIGLLSLLPNRHQAHLPHSVTCLAEIFSFLYNSPLLSDAAFSGPRSKADLQTRLTGLNATGQPKRFAFGLCRGRDGKEGWMVDRIDRRGNDLMILN